MLLLGFWACAQVGYQLRDDLVRVDQWGRQWLVLRHRGRAAMVSSHGDAVSCRKAKRLSYGLGLEIADHRGRILGVRFGSQSRRLRRRDLGPQSG